MADFRRWILALAVVALLAGLSVPAGAQPIVCNTSVTVTPVVRAEGLAELVGDLVLYCTGGTPTTPGKPVPQVNFTIFLNTNITSKVLGTQLVAFGNGQTSALDEALLIIDEPNSPNSPGVQCGPTGSFNGQGFISGGFRNFCLGGLSNGVPYPILNCGAVVGGVPAAPDGGPSGPGVCEIIAPNGGTAANPVSVPEHTYDGTVAGGYLLNSGNQFPDLCGVSLQSNGSPTVVTVFGLLVSGSNVIGTVTPATTGILVGATASDSQGAIPSGTLVTAVSSTTVTLSNKATINELVLGNDTLTFTTSLTVNTNQNGDVTSGNTIIVNLTSGTGGLAVGESVSGSGIPSGSVITQIDGPSAITISHSATSTKAGDALTFGVTTVQTQAGSVGAPGYSCGRPNVFQGRIGALQNPNQYNAVTFLGVPFDPPGTGIGRTIRITNIRANAAQLGVSSTYTTQQILMNVAINGPTALTIANPQQIVAYVNKGLSSVAIAPANNQNYNNVSAVGESAVPSGLLGGGSLRSGVAPNVPIIGEFVQCISQNPDLFAATPAPSFLIPGYLGANPITGSTGSPLAGGYNCPTGGDCLAPSPDVSPWVRFTEGFATSWKEKNISFTVGDGTGTTSGAANATYNSTVLGFNCPQAYCYNGKRNYPVDVPQNVPGAIYNTETGFSYAPVSSTYGAPPNPNPPVGFQFNSTLANSTVPNNGNPFSDDWSGSANATGIAGAGIADQGTRLYLSFGNIPNGASVWVSPVVYLFRQGVQHNGDPATLNTNPINGVAQSQSTGVMVLTNTDGSGAGAFSRTATTSPFQLTKVGSTGLAVYEILYTDPYSPEYVDVPVVLAYASNPGQNLPAPAPPNPNTNVTGGFAPFYTSAASTQPSPNATFQSPRLPVPRFVPGTAFDFINVQKCSCNVLFPFVANALGYDTGIAVANASLDPGGTFGFLGTPQPGTVQFWYYGDMSNAAAVPGPQTSTAVQPGHVLTYVLSSGSTQYGLDGRGAGLTGYIIAQAQFQYCHAYAFISAQGAGPTSPGTSEGYLGIILDRPGLPRTISIGENDAH